MTTRIRLPSPAFVGRLADAIDQNQTLEQTVRPLLQLMQEVTGLDATFLTFIDEAAGQQQVLFVHDSNGRLALPEPMDVPWEHSLCRRALDEGPGWVSDVMQRWGDSEVVRSLGIATYAMAPLRDDNGRLLGTLCGASTRSMPAVEGADRLLGMFAALIRQYIAREALIDRLRLAQQALHECAETDVLTGLPNRRALLQEMQRRLDQHAEAGTDLVIGFIDLDGFKAINDHFGHVIGDRFLTMVGERLRRGQRPEDYCARIGGDEFVTLTSLGHGAPMDVENQLRRRLLQATGGCYAFGHGVVIDYPGASVGFCRSGGQTDAVALLARADAAMYLDKQRRRHPALRDPAQPPGC